MRLAYRPMATRCERDNCAPNAAAVIARLDRLLHHQTDKLTPPIK
jgi:hypothetical protein